MSVVVNDARAANRLRLLVLFVTAAAMALGSFWVREVLLHGNDRSGAATQRNSRLPQATRWVGALRRRIRTSSSVAR